MKLKSLALGTLLLFASPQAGAAFWTTCDFNREGELNSDSFLVLGSGLGQFIRNGRETGLVWLRTGDTFHLFAEDEWPQRWLLSFNSNDKTAVSYSEGIAVHAASCRDGGE